MSVSHSITFKAFKFLTLLVALAGTIDASFTSGGYKGSGPLLKPEKFKKNFSLIKFIAITGARFISCPDLIKKYLVGVEMNISKIIFFCKCRRISLKLVIFLFCDLPACNKKADILTLTTALIAHIRSQFNHVFALLIPMPRFKSIHFC